MRHLSKKKKFGRTSGKRDALLKGLVCSLIEREKITTTATKAKAIRPLVEKAVTRGKDKNLSAIRFLNSLLDAKTAKKICEVIAPRYQSRLGGYTKILKLPARKSDGSPMAIIEFIK